MLTDFKDDSLEKKKMKAVIQANYNQVKQDVISIVDMEIQRIRRDPALRHLLRNK